MAIVDEPLKANKPIVVRTNYGEVFLHTNFSIREDQPIRGMIRIEDHDDERVYWFNLDHIVWIGPR